MDASVVVASSIGVIGAAVGGTLPLAAERLRARDAYREREAQIRREAYSGFMAAASTWGNALYYCGRRRAEGVDGPLDASDAHQALMEPMWRARLLATRPTRNAIDGVMAALYAIDQAWRAGDESQALRAHDGPWKAARDAFHEAATAELPAASMAHSRTARRRRRQDAD